MVLKQDALCMLQGELERCMEELNVLQAKRPRRRSKDRQPARSITSTATIKELEEDDVEAEESGRKPSPAATRGGRGNTTTKWLAPAASKNGGGDDAVERGNFVPHPTKFHREVHRRWGETSDEQLKSLIMRKVGAFTTLGRMDPELQPLVQELVDRLLEDADEVAPNLRLTPSTPTQSEMLMLSAAIVSEGVRVRGLREHVREGLRAFVRVMETTSKNEAHRRHDGAAYEGLEAETRLAFTKLYERLPLMMRPGYEGHDATALHLLRTLVLDLLRKVMILGTHVAELALFIRQYAAVRSSLADE